MDFTLVRDRQGGIFVSYQIEARPLDSALGCYLEYADGEDVDGCFVALELAELAETEPWTGEAELARALNAAWLAADDEQISRRRLLTVQRQQLAGRRPEIISARRPRRARPAAPAPASPSQAMVELLVGYCYMITTAQGRIAGEVTDRRRSPAGNEIYIISNEHGGISVVRSDQILESRRY